jgi:hypothetical protein
MKPTFLEDTVKEKTRSRRRDTFKEPQNPPVATSRAREADSSSRRKDNLPKDTTIMK